MPSRSAIINNDPYYCTRCESHHKWRHQEGDFRVFPEDIRECCANAMGSHWHCARCDKLGSMMGCYTTWCRKDTSREGGHMCCPGNCEFDE